MLKMGTTKLKTRFPPSQTNKIQIEIRNSFYWGLCPVIFFHVVMFIFFISKKLFVISQL